MRQAVNGNFSIELQIFRYFAQYLSKTGLKAVNNMTLRLFPIRSFPTFEEVSKFSSLTHSEKGSSRSKFPSKTLDSVGAMNQK